MTKKRTEDLSLPDAYGDTYRKALDELTSPTPFTYDYTADPAYQAYRKEYVREGRRAAEDAMGAYAAMTGGVPSTAAVTASQQAGDYYGAKLSDKIPELYRLAYDMYEAAEARRLKAIDALRAARGDELARWDAEQSRLAGERDFDYRRERDSYADRVALAKLAGTYGDYSGLEGLGIDMTDRPGRLYAYGGDGGVYEIGSAKGKAFVESAAPGQTMTGGDGSVWTRTDTGVTITRDGRTWTLALAAPAANTGSGGGRGSAKTKPELTAAQVNAAIANGIRTDKVLEAYEYYYGEPFDGGGAEPETPPIDYASVNALGYGPISDARLAELVASGAVEEYTADGKRRYRRAAAPAQPPAAPRLAARLT